MFYFVLFVYQLHIFNFTFKHYDYYFCKVYFWKYSTKHQEKIFMIQIDNDYTDFTLLHIWWCHILILLFLFKNSTTLLLSVKHVTKSRIFKILSSLISFIVIYFDNTKYLFYKHTHTICYKTNSLWKHEGHLCQHYFCKKNLLQKIMWLVVNWNTFKHSFQLLKCCTLPTKVQFIFTLTKIKSTSLKNFLNKSLIIQTALSKK